MDFDFSDMQRMLLDSAKRLLGDRYSLDHRRALRDTPDGLDRELWASFAEMGWLALAIPEEQGGLGGTLTDVAVLMTAFGESLVTEPFISSAVLATHILCANGAQPALVAALAAGEARVALADQEPDDRYAAGTPRAASLKRSGNGHLLNGRKMLVLDAPSADMLIVTADIAGESGTGLILVDAAAAGVTTQSYPLIDGMRAADMRFDDVAVAPEMILAGADRGPAVLAEAIDRSTIALMAQAVGSMEACLRLCSAYLKERQQFGQPIGKFQSLQHIMADMFVATHQARSALYQALAHGEGSASARARAISLAKLTVGEAGQLVSRQAVQLHGGYGMTDEYEVGHHYRRLLVIEKLYGDGDFHLRRLTAIGND